MDASSPRRPLGMESPTLKFPQSEGSPLHPVSPRRINQQRMAGSPAPPELSHLQTRKDRSGSDVQSKVEFLNRLSGIGSPSPLPRSSTTTAAIQRAILGREEAEAALQEAISELSESKSRERRVSERLESLLEELHARKERQSHERSLFEKEVRKARKEAFRAGSAVVKAQEELKSCRAEIKALREEVMVEREGKDQAKQEAFERAYTLAGLTEEIEILRDKVRASEAGNQSELLEARAEAMCGETPENQTSATGRESISSVASRGVKRVQPDSSDDSSPARKKSFSPGSSSNLRPTSPVESRETEQGDEKDLLQDLKNDLLWEKRQRQKAEDMIHFLKMECQFKQCSCRVAERQGTKYIHDTEWVGIPEEEEEEEEEEKDEETADKPHNQEPEKPEDREQTPIASQPNPTPHECSMNDTRIDYSTIDPQQPPDTVMTFCPNTGTFRALPSPRKDSSALIPPTPINREEALAQIRARRSRTKSALKRSASANDANTRHSKAESARVQANLGRRGVSGAY